jgi:hypothetical protein
MEHAGPLKKEEETVSGLGNCCIGLGGGGGGGPLT